MERESSDDETNKLIRERTEWQNIRAEYTLKVSVAQANIEKISDRLATISRLPYGVTGSALDIPNPPSLTDRVAGIKRRIMDLLWAYETGER